jgi:hypothetical protein
MEVDVDVDVDDDDKHHRPNNKAFTYYMHYHSKTTWPAEPQPQHRQRLTPVSS